MRPNNGGNSGRGKGRGRPPGKPARPPSSAEAVECSCAFLRSSARLLLRWRSLPVPGLQQPQMEPGQPVGDQESISCRLLGRCSLLVHSDGVVEVNDVDAALLITLLANSGGENCAARCGEKNRDVGGSTGLKPAPIPVVLEQVRRGRGGMSIVELMVAFQRVGPKVKHEYVNDKI